MAKIIGQKIGGGSSILTTPAQVTGLKATGKDGGVALSIDAPTGISYPYLKDYWVVWKKKSDGDILHPYDGQHMIFNKLEFDHILENNSWEQISTASEMGVASSIWSIGDTKSVNINGTVGTQAINGTFYVYIIGFDHNSELEGNGITFGTFKTAAANGVDVCLVDSHYNNVSTDGQKWFNMNHSSNTNSGGWNGCDLRYDILGSTNVNNGDATSTCATSPVSGTLMAALPSDLRAVMKPITKYTDNKGNKSNIAENVTATIDYLPLLAEFEIFGTRTYANSAEQNYQQQYAYYSAGNSKVKYRHSATGSTAFWWERSPGYAGSSNFCYVSTTGAAYRSGAGFSLGLAPAFRV